MSQICAQLAGLPLNESQVHVYLNYACMMNYFMFQLALNALHCVHDYYQLAMKDSSRDGITRRKVTLECISGCYIREASQLSQLAEFMGARKATLFECSKSRSSAEDEQKLKPLVEMMARKPPEGESIITLDWRIKAGNFRHQFGYCQGCPCYLQGL